MHRCLIEPAQWGGEILIPSPEEEHHLVRVLRIQPGRIVRVFDGCGHDAFARVEKDPDTGRIVLYTVDAAEVVKPTVELTLIQAIPKGRRMDLIIEQGTELGVHRILPVFTARGVVRLEDERSRNRLQRWRRIAAGAAKQCGLSIVPEIAAPVSLRDALDMSCSEERLLFGSLRDNALPLKDVIIGLKRENVRRLAVVIGPEGDLTDDEINLINSRGGVGVDFGPLVLRVETAALFVASVIACEFRSISVTEDGS